eukprot:4242401-Prymnesium_polylepis.1
MRSLPGCGAATVDSLEERHCPLVMVRTCGKPKLGSPSEKAVRRRPWAEWGGTQQLAGAGEASAQGAGLPPLGQNLAIQRPRALSSPPPGQARHAAAAVTTIVRAVGRGAALGEHGAARVDGVVEELQQSAKAGCANDVEDGAHPGAVHIQLGERRAERVVHHQQVDRKVPRGVALCEDI